MAFCPGGTKGQTPARCCYRMIKTNNLRHSISWASLFLRIFTGIVMALHAVTILRQAISMHYEIVLPSPPEAVWWSVLHWLVMPMVQLLAAMMLCLGWARRLVLPVLSVTLLYLLFWNVLEDFQWPPLSLFALAFLIYWIWRHLPEDRISFDRLFKYLRLVSKN